MNRMELVDPDPSRDLIRGGVAHMPARGGVVPDPMEVQSRDRLAVGVVREPEADKGALPAREGEARLVVDDLAERLPLVDGRRDSAEDDIREVTRDLDRAHDLLVIDVGALQEGVECSEDPVHVGARGDLDDMLPASVGGHAEGDPLMGVEFARSAIDGDPPRGAPDTDDLPIEVMHHAKAESAATELLAHRRAPRVVPGEEPTRPPGLIDASVPTEALVQGAPQVGQGSVVHGASVRDREVTRACWLSLRRVGAVTPLQFDDAQTAALLFDCDGTLVDTMGVHRVIWTEIFGRYGFAMTDEWWHEYCNVAVVPFVRAVVPDASEALCEQLNAESMEMYVDVLHHVEPLEHVIEIAREAHGRLPLAVVTGGYRQIIIPTLDAAGITHLFDVVVTADDVIHSKPAPDVYARAAHLLEVDPAHCIAYEDSEIGMASAHAAGVGRVVDIRLL